MRVVAVDGSDFGWNLIRVGPHFLHAHDLRLAGVEPVGEALLGGGADAIDVPGIDANGSSGHEVVRREEVEASLGNRLIPFFAGLEISNPGASAFHFVGPQQPDSLSADAVGIRHGALEFWVVEDEFYSLAFFT